MRGLGEHLRVQLDSCEILADLQQVRQAAAERARAEPTAGRLSRPLKRPRLPGSSRAALPPLPPGAMSAQARQHRALPLQSELSPAKAASLPCPAPPAQRGGNAATSWAAFAAPPAAAASGQRPQPPRIVHQAAAPLKIVIRQAPPPLQLEVRAGLGDAALLPAQAPLHSLEKAGAASGRQGSPVGVMAHLVLAGGAPPTTSPRR